VIPCHLAAYEKGVHINKKYDSLHGTPVSVFTHIVRVTLSCKSDRFLLTLAGIFNILAAKVFAHKNQERGKR
jgi:hypothetical protein